MRSFLILIILQVLSLSNQTYSLDSSNEAQRLKSFKHTPSQTQIEQKRDLKSNTPFDESSFWLLFTSNYKIENQAHPKKSVFHFNTSPESIHLLSIQPRSPPKES